MFVNKLWGGPDISRVTARWRAGWCSDGIRAQRNLHLEPNQVTFGGHFLAKTAGSSLSASALPHRQKPEGLHVVFFPADCLMAGKNPTLSDPCNTPSVNKHRAHNEKQPTPKCLSFIIQTDFPNKESKQKNKSNVQVIKGAEFCLPPHYSRCWYVCEVTPTLLRSFLPTTQR